MKDMEVTMTNQKKLFPATNDPAEKAYNRQIERYLKVNHSFVKQYSYRFCLRIRILDGLCTMVLACDGKDACLKAVDVPEDKIALMINRYDRIVYGRLYDLSLNKLRDLLCGWLEEFGCNYTNGRPVLNWPACKEFLDAYIAEDSYEDEI